MSMSITDTKKLTDLIVGIKGAGEMASGIAWRLHQANIRQIFMMEVPRPLAVRREVSFCKVLTQGEIAVEGIGGIRVGDTDDISFAWANKQIAVIADPEWTSIGKLKPDVIIDAIIAKRNLGTNMNEAPLVIALGPGFTAGKDSHIVIETNRGHNLGKLIFSGTADPDTGVPGDIGGYTNKRVLRAPSEGLFASGLSIGDQVRRGDIIGNVDGNEIRAEINGVLRGLILSGTRVRKNVKLGDIDPRGNATYCTTISDKARAIAGAVLEAILNVYNR